MKPSHYLTLGAAVAAFAAIHAIGEQVETQSSSTLPTCCRDADDTEVAEGERVRDAAILVNT